MPAFEERQLEDFSKYVFGMSYQTLQDVVNEGDVKIYKEGTMGADAVLLICALLETSMIREFLDIAASVGLDVLVEAHDESEVESALNAGAEIIGVNNRNLKDFSVDLQIGGGFLIVWVLIHIRQKIVIVLLKAQL